MKRTVELRLGTDARPIGTLRYEQRGTRERCAFEYGAEWLAAEDRFTVDPALQLVAGPQFHPAAPGGCVFHGAIADTEPDGWGKRVIQRDHAKRRQAARRAGKPIDPRPLGSLDYLLSVDDETRLGALRFQDETGTFCRTVEPGRRATPLLMELEALSSAAQAVETNTETMSDLAYLRGRGTSLGGLRPKCGVIDEDQHLSVAKFPSVDDERAVTRGEVLALHLARAAGARRA